MRVHISQLPADLLARVFEIMQEEVGCLGIGYMAAVCHLFRHSVHKALSTSVLELDWQRDMRQYRGVRDDPTLVSALARTTALCTRLVRLDLSAAHRHLQDAHLLTMAGKLPHLKELSISHCTSVTSNGLQALVAGGLPRLKEVHIDSCQQLEDVGVLQHLPALTTLSATFCIRLVPASVAPLGNQLRRLSLRGCTLADDSICGALVQVEVLDLSFTAVSDAGLQQLAVNAVQLQQLILAAQQYNLWSCGAYTQAGLAAFHARRPEVLVMFIVC